MKNSTKITQKIIKNYAKYLIACEKLKNVKDVKLITLQRLLCPYCKTTMQTDKTITLNLKGSNNTVRITHSPKNPLFCDYFLIESQNNFDVKIQIAAISLKELMKKINHSYNLITIN